MPRQTPKVRGFPAANSWGASRKKSCSPWMSCTPDTFFADMPSSLESYQPPQISTLRGLRRLLTAEWQAINNGEIQAPGFDIASEPVQFTLSNTHAIQLGLEAFNYVWASRPTTCSLFLFLNDFRTPKPSLSPRRRRSATKFVWVVSGARSSDLPQHAVRVFLSLQVLNRRLSNTQDIDTPYD
ncbi:hypothetical protein RB213_005680 [Colletotrichum asianum]